MSGGGRHGGEHRKTIEHFNIPGHAHELTFSTAGRLPLLVEDAVRAMLGDAIERACEGHGFQLVAFVFMPEHVHLIVHHPGESHDVAALLRAIKRPSSFRIGKLMESRGDPRLHELRTVRHDRIGLQFWQQGPGYDRNIINRETLATMIRYLHANPVKRGLCSQPEDWVWSSAVQYRAGREPIELQAGVPRITRLI